MRQLNLLPRERRRALRRALTLDAVTNLVRSLFWSLLLVTVVGLAAGGGLAFVSWWEGQAGLSVFEHRMAEYTRAQQAVAQRNQLIEAIDRLGRERMVWSGVLQQLLPVLPPGATIETLQLDAAERSVVVAGAAATRAEVVILEDRLRGQPWVAGLEAPRGNLLAKENAPYTFTLSIDASRLEASREP